MKFRDVGHLFRMLECQGTALYKWAVELMLTELYCCSQSHDWSNGIVSLSSTTLSEFEHLFTRNESNTSIQLENHIFCRVDYADVYHIVGIFPMRS